MSIMRRPLRNFPHQPLLRLQISLSKISPAGISHEFIAFLALRIVIPPRPPWAPRDDCGVGPRSALCK